MNHPIVTPFGPLKAPIGKVIHAERRFVRPIPAEHLRIVEESPDLCELLRERDDHIPVSDGWLLVWGAVGALIWVAIFFALGWVQL